MTTHSGPTTNKKDKAHDFSVKSNPVDITDYTPSAEEMKEALEESKKKLKK